MVAASQALLAQTSLPSKHDCCKTPLQDDVCGSLTLPLIFVPLSRAIEGINNASSDGAAQVR
jgi:hypothetical protein